MERKQLSRHQPTRREVENHLSIAHALSDIDAVGVEAGHALPNISAVEVDAYPHGFNDVSQNAVICDTLLDVSLSAT